MYISCLNVLCFQYLQIGEYKEKTPFQIYFVKRSKLLIGSKGQIDKNCPIALIKSTAIFFLI
jgi:hypothetical protein